MSWIAPALAVPVFAGIAAAQCSPVLDPNFGYSALDGEIAASTVFDDGSGPALFVGGNFASYQGTPLNSIARWNGQTYEPVGGGFNGTVNALVVWDDDGAGPHAAALYAAGGFTTANNGATPVSRIARWDGQAWTALPGTFSTSSAVHALGIHNDGSGEKLIVGGRFSAIDGAPYSALAAFDGQSWHSVAGGVTLTGGTAAVYAVLSVQEPGGPALYVGGDFSHANETPARALARLSNGQWSALGTGVTYTAFSGATPKVQTLAAADLPTTGGPCIIAGGIFDHAGGLAVAGIAKWSGAGWARLQHSGLNQSWGNVRMVGVADLGSGPALYASNYNGLERWNGSSWDLVGPGVFRAYTMSVDTSAPAPRMYLAGQFTRAGDVGAPGLAMYDGDTFTGLGAFGRGTNGAVMAMTTGDIGDGQRVFAIGAFTHAGGDPAPGAAVWDGTSWAPVGNGLAEGTDLRAITVFDDGSGPTLFVASVQDAIYKLVNGSWQLLPELNFWTNALVVHDPDAGGPSPQSLYAVGQFVQGGGRHLLARWTGSNWDYVPTPGLSTSSHAIAALSFDADGVGPQPAALYLAGSFSINSERSLIVKWDGSTWTPQAPEFTTPSSLDFGYALAAHDDGAGPRLHVAGSFLNTTVLRLNHDGTWQPVSGATRPYFPSGGAVSPNVRALLSVDRGQGAELVLLGSFSSSNANPLVLHDGVWQSYGHNLYNMFIGSGATYTGVVFNDGSGPALFIGGQFTGASSPGPTYRAASNIAKFHLCRSGCTADFNGDGDSGTDQDIEAFFACLGGSCCPTCGPADFNNDGDTGTDQDIESFFRVLAGGPC